MTAADRCAREREMIRAQLAGNDWRDASLEGLPLTEPEWALLRALFEVGPSMERAAKALLIHPSGAKYRLERIRRKYGLPQGGPTPWLVLREALRRGDVAVDRQEADAVEAFLAEVHRQMPLGQLTPVWLGIETWLRDLARRYLAGRAAA